MKTNYQMKAKHLNSNQVNIDKQEVLRYLQYNNEEVDEVTNILLNESIDELKRISELKYVYRIFNIEKEHTSLNFEEEFVIKSKDLSSLLKNSDKVALMAATLGLTIEKRIRYYSLTNLSKGIIFDSCATAYIEALCDFVEAEVKKIAKKDNCSITYRYSPGYGDLPISHQSEILNSLNAGNLIGLTTSHNSILIPRKSVTAFIGFNTSNRVKPKVSSCKTCSLSATCGFSKEGGSCDR